MTQNSDHRTTITTNIHKGKSHLSTTDYMSRSGMHTSPTTMTAHYTGHGDSGMILCRRQTRNPAPNCSRSSEHRRISLTMAPNDDLFHLTQFTPNHLNLKTRASNPSRMPNGMQNPVGHFIIFFNPETHSCTARMYSLIKSKRFTNPGWATSGSNEVSLTALMIHRSKVQPTRSSTLNSGHNRIEHSIT